MMCKKTMLLGIIPLFSSILLSVLAAETNPYAGLLTAADVEKFSGLKGIKEVEKNPLKGAGGDLNFAKMDGQMVVMVTFQDAGIFDVYKSQRDNVKAVVPGVAEDAFIGPGFMDPQYILILRKGKYCVSLSTYMLPSNPPTTVLSMEQLKSLAKIIVSRL